MSFKNIRTSFGLACCRYDTSTNRWKILLAKKRYTHCFVSFVFGQYTKKDDKRLRNLFNNMTYQEKIDIMSMRFELLWYKIWLELPNIYTKQKFEFNLSNAESIINTWLTASFEGGRHQTRIDMLDTPTAVSNS